jgi:hypothetical protein
MKGIIKMLIACAKAPLLIIEITLSVFVLFCSRLTAEIKVFHMIRLKA